MFSWLKKLFPSKSSDHDLARQAAVIDALEDALALKHEQYENLLNNMNGVLGGIALKHNGTFLIEDDWLEAYLKGPEMVFLQSSDEGIVILLDEADSDTISLEEED